MAARREPWLNRTRGVLMRRSGQRCEGECGRRDISLDPAHLVGRNNKGLSEPWASCPEMMVAICRDEHNAIDRGLNDRLLADLRWQGYVRLVRTLGLPLAVTHVETGEEGLFAIRALIRYCEEQGITHPDFEAQR